MPSVYSLLAVAALTITSTASPLPIFDKLFAKTAATLPTTSGQATQLPPPSSGLTLKHVTLGRGVQNYTCTAGVATPVAQGAIATLFDITPLATTAAGNFLLTYLPAMAVYQKLPTGQAVNTVQYPGTDRLVVIGKHFFDSAGTPVFDLYTTGEKLLAKKVGQAAPPPNANAGPAGTGAVLWLKLDDKGGSKGLKEVYRVVTAGGNATPACKKAGAMSIEYATEYWFYG